MRLMVALMLLWASAVLAVACGGSDPGPAPTAVISPTAAPTPPQPTAQDPIVPRNVVELGSGTLLLAVPNTEPALVDSLTVAAKDGIAPPACAGFVFVTSWLVVSPYPPGDVQIEVSAMRQGSRTVVGNSASGGATTGCDVLQFENLSDVPLVIEVRYVVAGLR